MTAAKCIVFALQYTSICDACLLHHRTPTHTFDSIPCRRFPAINTFQTMVASWRWLIRLSKNLCLPFRHVCALFISGRHAQPQVLILVNLRSPCLQGMLAGSSHESLDGRASLPRMKSYDAVVFDTLRVSPEDFAVSTCMNTLFYSRYAFQEICLS